MKPIGTHNYFVYIVTNINKTVLYTDVTNDISRRLYEHELEARTTKKTFAGRYNVYYLIYWERFEYVEHAIDREKQIKGWTRAKKEKLISEFNAEWKFFNDQLD